MGHVTDQKVHRAVCVCVPTSWEPWEKFIRAMFIPDLIISLSMSTEREAGPVGGGGVSARGHDNFETNLAVYSLYAGGGWAMACAPVYGCL